MGFREQLCKVTVSDTLSACTQILLLKGFLLHALDSVTEQLCEWWEGSGDKATLLRHGPPHQGALTLPKEDSQEQRQKDCVTLSMPVIPLAPRSWELFLVAFPESQTTNLLSTLQDGGPCFYTEDKAVNTVQPFLIG